MNNGIDNNFPKSVKLRLDSPDMKRKNAARLSLLSLMSSNFLSMVSGSSRTEDPFSLLILLIKA